VPGSAGICTMPITALVRPRKKSNSIHGLL
jgi:hypothetical protein